jgi:hypothetical protein
MLSVRPTAPNAKLIIDRAKKIADAAWFQYDDSFFCVCW